MNALHDIQTKLKVGKENTNTFGKYNYRNCSDILEAVKPLLPEGFSLLLSDEIVLIGERYYVKATAILSNGKESSVVTAFARESFDKKGMDDSQITGASSSYARKYALNGLFAIDDTKDADSMDNTGHKTATKADTVAEDALYTAVCDKWLDSLVCIREALKSNDYSTAKEAWNELDADVKSALWKAPSKGGWFTTREREQMRCNEWSAA